MPDLPTHPADGLSAKPAKMRYVKRFFVGGPLDGQYMSVLEGTREYVAPCLAVELLKHDGPLVPCTPIINNARYSLGTVCHEEGKHRHYWTVFLFGPMPKNWELIVHQLRENRIPAETRCVQS